MLPGVRGRRPREAFRVAAVMRLASRCSDASTSASISMPRGDFAPPRAIDIEAFACRRKILVCGGLIRQRVRDGRAIRRSRSRSSAACSSASRARTSRIFNDGFRRRCNSLDRRVAAGDTSAMPSGTGVAAAAAVCAADGGLRSRFGRFERYLAVASAAARAAASSASRRIVRARFDELLLNRGSLPSFELFARRHVFERRKRRKTLKSLFIATASNSS